MIWLWIGGGGFLVFLAWFWISIKLSMILEKLDEIREATEETTRAIRSRW